MLARDLKMTVRRLRRELTTDEYVGWMALYELEAYEREKAESKARARSGGGRGRRRH